MCQLNDAVNSTNTCTGNDTSATTQFGGRSRFQALGVSFKELDGTTNGSKFIEDKRRKEGINTKK